MKKAVVFTIMIALLAGCSHKNDTEKKDQDQAIFVKTAPVVLVSTEQNFGYSGTVEASVVIPLSFKTTGTVEQVFVEPGDAVRKGQVLATLDDSDLQNIHSTMLAKYQQAEDAYNRLKLVYDQGSLPEIKWVEMKSNYEQAKAALDLAKNNLDKCQLTAPVDGIVGRRNIEPGQSSITLTSAPVELVKIETVHVKISVPENEINKITTGQSASLSVTALDGKQYSGKVTNISPVAEVMSRTYTVKILVNNASRELKPGMVCDVSIGYDPEKSILVVPKRAVGKDPAGNTYVFVVSTENTMVKKQVVTVGKYQEAGIEITGGLNEGQVVVSEGIEKLSDNSKIKPEHETR